MIYKFKETQRYECTTALTFLGCQKDKSSEEEASPTTSN